MVAGMAVLVAVLAVGLVAALLQQRFRSHGTVTLLNPTHDVHGHQGVDFLSTPLHTTHAAHVTLETHLTAIESRLAKDSRQRLRQQRNEDEDPDVATQREMAIYLRLLSGDLYATEDDNQS